MGEAGGSLQQQGVHERLREVAAQLPLGDVELLGIQAGRAAGAAAPFKPSIRVDHAALLVFGQCHDEPAQQERSLCFFQGAVVVAETVNEVVLGQLVAAGGEGGAGARVVGGQGATDGGQQQGRIDRWAVGGALPVAVGVHTVGG